MYVIFSVLIVVAAAGCLAKPTKIPVIDWIPVLFFLIIIVLFLFYCMDLLAAGLTVVYILLAAASVYSLYKAKCTDGRALLSASVLFTPAVCMFLLLTGVLYLYTCKNHSVTIDDLRLWAAVPRALWNTGRLQLGKDSPIFSIMQSYLPGMPLFEYFLIAHCPVYNEAYLFWCYGIFAALLLIPNMRELKFSQRPLFVLLFLLVIATPGFLSNNKIYYYFTVSIDCALGMFAGYCFYLSATNPFANPFTVLRFSVSLAVLTLLKDSGSGFALCAAMNAVLLAMIDGKEEISRVRKIAGSISAVGAIVAVYVIWQCRISSFGVKNHLGLHALPGFDVIRAIFTASWRQGIWVYKFTKSGMFISLSIPFFACFWLIILFAMQLSKRYRDISRKASISTMVIMWGYAVVFALGIGSIFGSGLPSFNRYISTITTCGAIYLLLRWIPVTIRRDRVPGDVRNGIVLICVMITMIYLNYSNGEECRTSPLIDVADHHLSQIAAQQPENEMEKDDIYLFLAEENDDSMLLHHMIYYRLLDSQFTVRNFLHDMHFEGTDDNAVDAARQWLERLVAEGYEYVVYVVTSNKVFENAVNQLKAGDSFRAETLYRLNGDGTIHRVAD